MSCTGFKIAAVFILQIARLAKIADSWWFFDREHSKVKFFQELPLQFSVFSNTAASSELGGGCDALTRYLNQVSRVFLEEFFFLSPF